MAIDNGISSAMASLGNYYYQIEKNYESAVKYYLMAISQENHVAMNNLGNYYYEVEKNYELAKKYYLMAIDKDSADSMFNLGHLYYKIEKNYELTNKYFLMSIEREKKTNPILNENKREQNIHKNKRNRFMKVVECPICLVDKECIPFECTHYFCDECYTKYYDKSCPICRL